MFEVTSKFTYAWSCDLCGARGSCVEPNPAVNPLPADWQSDRMYRMTGIPGLWPLGAEIICPSCWSLLMAAVADTASSLRAGTVRVRLLGIEPDKETG